ncbi:MAG: pyrroline-5-carboxylate reductase [Tissierellia bacterium]|nr:pyrroline-5-carboxylate reductase [Tissierellia bacterium]
MKIGFAGCGNMGKAMLKGLLTKGFADKSEVFVHTERRESMDKIKSEFGVNIMDSNADAAKESDIIILAIKPDKYKEVIKEIKKEIKAGSILLGITPALTIATMEKHLDRKDVLVARAMPNTPAMVMVGMTGISFSKRFDDGNKKVLMDLFASMGEVIEIDEGLMGAIGSLSGASPAYTYMLIEAMGEMGIQLGFKAKDAYRISAMAVMGSAKMVLESGDHPAILRDNVCSPNGTTIAGVNELEANGFKGNIQEAMLKSLKRFKDLEH